MIVIPAKVAEVMRSQVKWGISQYRQEKGKSKIDSQEWKRIWNDYYGNGQTWDATDSLRIGQSRQGRPEYGGSSTKNSDWEASWSNNDGGWPSESPICLGNDGISGSLDGITFSKWSEETIKGAGNTIVPQLILQIFKSIEQWTEAYQ